MWINIRDNFDIENLMEVICGFHDSCVKEIKYKSGAYVKQNLDMYPINKNRILEVIIQTQNEQCSMIQMRFEGLNFIKLFPLNENYTCEILDASLIISDGLIYWYDSADIPIDNIDKYEGIVICAKKMQWRKIENKMGPEDFFIEA